MLMIILNDVLAFNFENEIKKDKKERTKIEFSKFVLFLMSLNYLSCCFNMLLISLNDLFSDRRVSKSLATS